MTEAQVVALLKRHVAKARSIRQWSRDHGIEHVFVWRVVTGERPLSDNVAAAVGFERVVTWRRKK
jgi:hypothetical protein